MLIARINTDISLADFENGVINFINDVEAAYWELYFAYHNLEVRVAGRNTSLLTWQRIKELQNVGARGGDAAAECRPAPITTPLKLRSKRPWLGRRKLLIELSSNCDI